ncbi:hypothetical protein DGo_PC0145 (plasmid) [Deinococcus gobiensis I-0]|uniref:Uncharacterized protein n=2 Tax=Deinococcus TaxID=1298 RepID=H8H340_DEIGI|nr:hypothetical protein DGo_PC0145 [Deinococcus gobiensis I-0]
MEACSGVFLGLGMKLTVQPVVDQAIALGVLEYESTIQMLQACPTRAGGEAEPTELAIRLRKADGLCLNALDRQDHGFLGTRRAWAAWTVTVDADDLTAQLQLASERSHAERRTAEFAELEGVSKLLGRGEVSSGHAVVAPREGEGRAPPA